MFIELEGIIHSSRKQVPIAIPVDHSINNYLDGILLSQQVDNFHGMLNDSNCHQLLPVVATMHHQRVSKPLHNWTLSFPEPLNRIPPRCVGNISGMFCWIHSNVILQRYVRNLCEYITKEAQLKNTVVKVVIQITVQAIAKGKTNILQIYKRMSLLFYRRLKMIISKEQKYTKHKYDHHIYI